MSNRKMIMRIVATTLVNILRDIIIYDICCMNCEYYYATPDNSFCTIDKQNIPCELSHIYKCKAFSEWFGKIDNP